MINGLIKKGSISAFIALILWAPAIHAQGVTHLNFLTWKPGISEAWDERIRSFERAHPEIRIRRQVGPQSSTAFHAILTQRFRNADASIDVFFMDVVWPAQFAAAGWLLDLTERFGVEARKAFLKGPVSANTYRERIWGVPLFIDAGLLFYRTDLLKKYGLPPPKQWQEMVCSGETITEKENQPFLSIYSGQFKQYEGLVCNLLEFIWSNGGAVFDSAKNRVLLGEPAVIDALDFVRDRIIGHAAPRGSLSYEEPESLSLFVQGNAVFHRNWPYAWTIANDPLKSKVAGKIGVVNLPAFPGHKPAPALGGWQLGISRFSRHPEAAWQFVAFMTSYESQKMLALKAGRAPTRKALYEDGVIREQAPHLIRFLPAFEDARPRPATPFYPVVSAVLQRFFSQAIESPNADVTGLAETATEQIRKVLRVSGR